MAYRVLVGFSVRLAEGEKVKGRKAVAGEARYEAGEVVEALPSLADAGALEAMGVVEPIKTEVKDE